MKTAFHTFVAIFCLSLLGCETARQDIVTGVREKFTGPTYVRRVYNTDSRSVFAAARDTAERSGFRITRSGAAQGVLDGVSGLTSDDSLRGSRQQTIKIRLTPATTAGVEVAVLFTEIIENDFNKGAGMGTESSLRNHPLYESFFNGLNQRLAQ